LSSHRKQNLSPLGMPAVARLDCCQILARLARHGALGVDDAVNVWRVRSPPGWASGCVTKIDECAIFVFA
jgi:hypothetical protein